MARRSTGLFKTLQLLYNSYGGWRSFLTSEYTYLSIALCAASWRMIQSEDWANLSKSILPTLAGFSVAAYAIVFSVLDERSRTLLLAPSQKLGGRSPLLILASSISHAAIIQGSGVIYAIIYSTKPIPTLPGWEKYAIATNVTFSTIGLFTLLYGMTLIIGSLLSVFRLLEIRSRSKIKSQ